MLWNLRTERFVFITTDSTILRKFGVSATPRGAVVEPPNSRKNLLFPRHLRVIHAPHVRHLKGVLASARQWCQSRKLQFVFFRMIVPQLEAEARTSSIYKGDGPFGS